MSTIVQIQVNVNDAKAIASLTNIETIGKRLSSTPIEIKVDTSYTGKATKNVVQYAKALANKTKQEAKSASAAAKVLVEQEKSARQTERLTAKQDKGAQSANKYATEQTKAASATQKAGTEAQKTSALTGLLGDSLGRIVAKQAAWQLIGNGIAAVKTSFVEALSTMKEVDSELATVRKVTGMTKDEMDALGESAYSTASKYGVAANEYLQNVSTFARAGYKEAAQGLGELAIKTQLVGDTDQETAAQFLLSADAAWKYHGNVEKLSLALDEANTIDNNYATSIQKIAEGLPIVANVASMAGMSMEETMAMIGTITATTQESGTKAATAARALILNILGDTTTEISDGVTATEESVQSLSGILQKYAPDVVAAAEATGKLINPMEAIEALSKAAKDGLISEADLMQMVSALGGKLRTNQLLALLKNFDMYKNMLADMGVAAGSADQEVSVMLDTWDAKANILKNTWTEFVSNMVDTSLIKGALDVITGLVKVLDSDFGHFVITVASVTAAFAGLQAVWKSLKSTSLGATLAQLLDGTIALKGGITALTTAMSANPLFWVAGGAAAIHSIVKLVSDLNVTYEEQVQIVKELSQEYDDLYGSGSEYDDLIKRANDLTEEEKNRLAVLEAEKLAMEDLIKMEKQRAADKFQEDWVRQTGNAVTKSNFGGLLNYNTEGQKKLAVLKDNVDWLSQSYQKGTISQADYRSGLGELINTYKDTADTIRDYKNNNVELSDSMLEFLDTYDAAAILLSEFAGTAGAASDTTTDTADALDSVAESADAATQAVERYNNALSSLTDREEAANDIQSKFKQALKDFQDGKLGSIELGKFVDTYIPSDVQREFKYNVQDMMEWALNGNVGRILNSDNMFGEFYDVIKENVDSSALDGIVTMDEQGVIRTITSYKELAEALQMTEAQAEAFGHGLSNYMDGVFYTGEEAQQIVGDVGKVLSTSFSDGTASLSDFTQALSEITGANTSTELSGVFAGLMRAGALDWKTMLGAGSMEEAMQIINSYLHSIDRGVDELSENPADVKINFDADEAMAGLNDLKSKKKQVEGPAEVQATVTGAAEAEQQLGDVKKAKDDASGDVESGVDASGAAEAASELRDVGDAANEIPDSKQIHVSVRDNASGVLNAIYSRLASIRSKTVTITTIEKKYKQTASGARIPTDAGGTQNSPGGRAVVNDGAPVNGSSAELIVDNGDAYIANGGKMAIVDLSPGAKVYTAKQTQDMLTGEKEEIPMHAGGTGLVRPGGNGGVYGGDHSGGTGVGGSTASNTEEDDPLKKEVSEKLDNIDKQIELARNRNDRAKEQALQEQAAKMVRDFVQQYLDNGYSNTSNEVLDLLNRGYGYSDDLMGELVDSLEALTDSTNAANKLAEKQQAVDKARQELENTKKQRTVRIYNPVTGQWEWAAKADDILKAQENLEKAEKDYQDTKIEQELEALKNGNIGDIGDLTMSPALRELIANASDEEQKRIADILHAISGGAKNTTDTTGESIFRSTDSHDVYYQFGDLKLSEAEAKNMTVKELAEKLKTLKLT